MVIANRLDLLPLMLDKFATAAKLTELGYAVIPTVPLNEWPSIAEKHGFPLIVKPTRETGGSRGLHLVRDAEELQRLLPLVERPIGP